jgi:hypothetical protein
MFSFAGLFDFKAGPVLNTQTREGLGVAITAEHLWINVLSAGINLDPLGSSFGRRLRRSRRTCDSCVDRLASKSFVFRFAFDPFRCFTEES